MEIKAPLVNPAPIIEDARHLIMRLLDALEENMPDDWYSSADLILEADDWLKRVDGEN